MAAAWNAVGVTGLSGNRHAINLSTRADVGTGNNIMTAGFTLAGSGTKQLVLRGIGPRLADFGVQGTLSNPQIELRNGTVFSPGTWLASNNDWGNQSSNPQLVSVSSQVSAFALVDNSLDAAMLHTLGSGNYLLNVSGVSGATGNALAEVYDTSPTSEPFLKTLTTRCLVTSGQVATAGIVIYGQANKTILIRAVGPTLATAPHNVSGTHTDPALTVYLGSTAIHQNNDWQQIADDGWKAAAAVASDLGVYPLGSGKKDAALVVTLSPGVYTAVASSNNGTSGLVQLEIHTAEELQ